MKRLFIFLLLISNCIGLLSQKPIKVLAIGNSFSADAVEQYLYELGAATGDSLVIGNAYIAGCSLERHWNNTKENKADYKFRKIVGGERSEQLNYTLLECVVNEDWDYITFQQASANSGCIDSYFPYLSDLQNYVKSYVSNRDVKFVLHLTWSYARNSKHSAFSKYDNDQFVMYNAIIRTVNEAAKQAGIEWIIPVGTAIQNARTSCLGDVFCRDGYHLNLSVGRYTAACTWYEFLTGKTVIGNEFTPRGLDECSTKIAQYAAHYANIKSNEITPLSKICKE